MTVLVTGCAGFIGARVTRGLLDRGDQVIGIDNLNAYYDPSLKRKRLSLLEKDERFAFLEQDISATDELLAICSDYHFDRIIHLAAQAGVRYSIDHPEAYVAANLTGHANILELARRQDVRHMVYASSSSVYGGNTRIPFSETDRTDDPVSFYGATKKADEMLAHSYARLYGLPMTGLRFFTVYGPWGRPDMAYWIFADRIRRRQPIRIFNGGDMGRDFTYIDDIADGVIAALDHSRALSQDDVPHRLYNLGNDKPEDLMSLVELLEQFLGSDAIRQFEAMQQGDVERTWANIDRARSELGYDPKVSLATGLQQFVNWFREYAD